MSGLPYILSLLSILLTAASVSNPSLLCPSSTSQNLTPSQLRLLYILPAIAPTRPLPRKRTTPTHLLIVLGSGGHTAELLSSLTSLKPQVYTHRSYIISSGDVFSALKAQNFEQSISDSKPPGIQTAAGYSIHEVPRARKIHQSLLTSPWSCLQCLWACLRLLQTHPEGRPDLILTNGPATSLVLVLASLMLRYLDFLDELPVFGGSRRGGHRSKEKGQMRTIYVESWARVKRPSLSGRIIAYGGLCNRVLVQWKGLEENGWGEYRGILVR